MFNSIPVPANHAEFHGDQPGTLAYYTVLLTDPSTEVTMEHFVDDGATFGFGFVISTPEGVKHSTHGVWNR